MTDEYEEHGRIIEYHGDAVNHGRKIVEVAPRSVLDIHHNEIHKGKGFLISASVLVNTDQYFELWLKTNDSLDRPHMILGFEASAAAKFELWYPTTKTFNAATEITPLNRDMESTNTSNVQACHTPLGTESNPANNALWIGSAGKNSATGGDVSSRDEYILPRNMAFLLKMTSRADDNAMTFTLNWYERDSESL